MAELGIEDNSPDAEICALTTNHATEHRQQPDLKIGDFQLRLLMRILISLSNQAKLLVWTKLHDPATYFFLKDAAIGVYW